MRLDRFRGDLGEGILGQLMLSRPPDLPEGCGLTPRGARPKRARRPAQFFRPLRESEVALYSRTGQKPAFSETGRGRQGRMPLAGPAKPLKRLKTAMGGYWKKLAWIWVWRHVRLGLAPRPFGIGGASARGRRRAALAANTQGNERDAFRVRVGLLSPSRDRKGPFQRPIP
jgi:hypothetical protein